MPATCLGSGRCFSSPIPTLVVGMRLTQVIRGVECLYQPLFRVNIYDARGVDKFSVRVVCVSEGVAHKVATWLQLAKTLRAEAFYN